ncbi:pentatricopeptide repeat-containing protein At2g17140-like [Phragmites australis]|uniref:pentatricopeptide repeat-containing protein At2g17140-like n=1 Tax=Phragmites australis TaxID=29695 RepID=UPI002D7A0DF6|nr:pentatricopeptide repeat-containing protein At2g17140-like [Phragmites australis]XP_062224158.1 pentatricopeptide repeat-containing protein At2g17140-like [Phragmites australis]XP_062224159.1 pentatricopeptide repeat-containing protein At2g17140-like [Phragmites australis]XP_062224160.1 pentatricopeptide repeat-containing protein At2g17140-like [Phragmites australis]XP_062224161.1 pentatricopeptide repeat-containing protein At2g17140-like [Phragmites australis]XP_062224162.1 pentatricopepti
MSPSPSAAHLLALLHRNAASPAVALRLFLHLSSPSSPPPPGSTSFLARLLAARPDTHALFPRLLRHILSFPDPSPHLLALLSASSPGLPLRLSLPAFRSLRALATAPPPPTPVYNRLILAALCESCLDLVEVLYKDLLLAGAEPDAFTRNLLLQALCDAGRMELARRVFDAMPARNEFSFGILVRGYCRAGRSFDALEVLDRMPSVNLVVCNTVVAGFCREGLVEEAETLVERMRTQGLAPNVVTFNARISALCKAGRVLDAYRIFKDMQEEWERGLPRPDQVTFDVMLSGFCEAGLVDEARVLVDIMRCGGFLRRVESYNRWLSGLVRNGRVGEAQELLREMAHEGIQPNSYTYNIIVAGLCKEGKVFDVRRVEDFVSSGVMTPDVVTYTSLLHAYCSKGNTAAANRILDEMAQKRCVPNSFTYNVLLQSLWRAGRTTEAEQLLERMSEKGYSLDTASCNIIVDGLCRNSKLDVAMGIVDGMWKEGSAALGRLGNSFLSVVSDSSSSQRCLPDRITYSILINALCKEGRFDEAKKKLLEMIVKDISPDSVVYDTFIHGYCKHGKTSLAIKVLRDMEKKGCNPSTRTYNLLIRGFEEKQKSDEILKLMNEMKEKGISPNVLTYNSLIKSFCERGMVNKAMPLLDEMLQNEIVPNITSFDLLIKAFCKITDFPSAQMVCDAALRTCGQKEVLYCLMCTELSTYGRWTEAKNILETALEMKMSVQSFPYKQIIAGLCEVGEVDHAHTLLKLLIAKGHSFDPAAFMPVIDALSDRGKKQDADMLSEKMMEMADCDDGLATGSGKITPGNRKHKRDKDDESDWRALLHRDDSARTIMKITKRVRTGWGQRGNVYEHKQQQNDDFYVLENTG